MRRARELITRKKEKKQKYQRAGKGEKRGLKEGGGNRELIFLLGIALSLVSTCSVSAAALPWLLPAELV